MMSQMFNSSSKPFYQSAISMGLDSIPLETYLDFACRMFRKRGKQVEPALVKNVYRRFEECTWFVQMLMNELFSLTAHGGHCGPELLETALNNVVMAQEGNYLELLSRLAPKKMLLQAIAKEGRAEGLTSAAFIRKYNLPSASSV